MTRHVISTHLLRTTARYSARRYRRKHPGSRVDVERAKTKRAKWQVVETR